MNQEKQGIVYTDKAPQPIGPYSQAVESGGLLFCSGQIALDPLTGGLQGSTAALQTEQVCQNIAAVLAAAGLGFAQVVKTTCFLVNPADFAPFNEVYAAHFTSHPARSCVFVAALPKGALVEIEVLANR
ncbi:MAG: Rid family detoxifying hydrolase [Eubacteriales bacterium]